MDKHCAQGLRVVGFEALNHEFDRSVVLESNQRLSYFLFKALSYHICQGEVAHVENNGLILVRIPLYHPLPY